MPPRQPRRDGWIDWRNSKPKKIIMEDLEEGVLPLDDNVISVEAAWQFYRQYREFESVAFDQFAARLKDHRKQVKKEKNRSTFDSDALAHDRQLFPRQTHNHRGEPVFDLSPAKMLLREDIENERHVGLTPTIFQNTRDEYKLFPLKIFRQRIYQELRRKKFVYYLERKRARARATRTTSSNTPSGT